MQEYHREEECCKQSPQHICKICCIMLCEHCNTKRPDGCDIAHELYTLVEFQQEQLETLMRCYESVSYMEHDLEM